MGEESKTTVTVRDNYGRGKSAEDTVMEVRGPDFVAELHADNKAYVQSHGHTYETTPDAVGEIKSEAGRSDYWGMLKGVVTFQVNTSELEAMPHKREVPDYYMNNPASGKGRGG